MLKKLWGILKLYTVYTLVGVLDYFAFEHIFVKFDINISIYIFDKIWMNEILFLFIVFSVINAIIMLLMHEQLNFKKTKLYLLKLFVVYIIGTCLSVFSFYFVFAISFALSMRGMG